MLDNNKKTMVVIGHSDVGMSRFAHELKDKGVDVILVDDVGNIEPDESFDLHGVRYAPIKTKSTKHNNRAASKINTLMAAASMIYMPYMHDYGESRYERKLPEGTDIIKEYGLIQIKQSKLSKWERDMVVAIFDRNFYRVQNVK